jgi:hypothetical protein
MRNLSTQMMMIVSMMNLLILEIIFFWDIMKKLQENETNEKLVLEIVYYE